MPGEIAAMSRAPRRNSGWRSVAWNEGGRRVKGLWRGAVRPIVPGGSRGRSVDPSVGRRPPWRREALQQPGGQRRAEEDDGAAGRPSVRSGARRGRGRPRHCERRHEEGHADRVRGAGVGDQAEEEHVGEAGAENREGAACSQAEAGGGSAGQATALPAAQHERGAGLAAGGHRERRHGGRGGAWRSSRSSRRHRAGEACGDRCRALPRRRLTSSSRSPTPGRSTPPNPMTSPATRDGVSRVLEPDPGDERRRRAATAALKIAARPAVIDSAA